VLISGRQASIAQNPPVAHAAPRDSVNRIERRSHLRLSPEAGEKPGAGQKVRTAFAVREAPDGCKNSVFPVYAGSLP